MNLKAEDRLGQFAMLAVFALIWLTQILRLAQLWLMRDHIPFWGLALVSQVLATLFVMFVLLFTLRRLPARDAATGVAPRLVAVLGTFVMMAMVALPVAETPPALRLVATLLVVAGTALSIHVLRALGRSFAIMATSRALVTTGPYGVVRHPLYGVELITMAGVMLGNLSIWSAGLFLLWLVLQIRRADYEEAVLRASFPDYADYARRVPRFIPRLG